MGCYMPGVGHILSGGHRDRQPRVPECMHAQVHMLNRVIFHCQHRFSACFNGSESLVLAAACTILIDTTDLMSIMTFITTPRPLRDVWTKFVVISL